MAYISDLKNLILIIPYEGLRWNKLRVSINENGILSNFHTLSRLIHYRGRSSNTTENLYMASKNPDHILDINGKSIRLIDYITSVPPGKAKRMMSMGSSVPYRDRWAEMEVSSMAYMLIQKYAENSPERLWLNEQDERKLVEWNTWNDMRWGIAFKKGDEYGLGKNALGLLSILIKRNEISSQPEEHWIEWQNELIEKMISTSMRVFS